MNHAITLTGSDLSYDIDVPTLRRCALEVHNEGPGVLYYGDIPKYSSGAPLTIAPADFVSTSCTTGSPVLTLGADAPASLVQGMILTFDGFVNSFPVPTAVLSVSGRKVTLSEDALSDDTDLTAYFREPTLDTTLGIPVQPGETVRFTGGYDNPTANRFVRLLAASGDTCTVRIRKA